MSQIGVRTIMERDRLNAENVLLGQTFVIKDYQRGYRWEKEEIEALLNDISGFSTDNGNTKYCLQPLVVKPMNCGGGYENSCGKMLNNEVYKNWQSKSPDCWELIDGQQRLTTVLLILDYCYNSTVPKDKLPYDIVYVNQRNIDKHYIQQAGEIIKKWFDDFGIQANDKKNDIRSKLHYDTLFIWYEVGEKANSSEVFTKLNMGKIPLTNAELFKALLLKSENVQNYGTENERLSEIAYDWNLVEQSLRDDDLWYFISNRQIKDSETRIDFLLNLYALSQVDPSAENGFRQSDPRFSFYVVNDLIKGGMPATEIWRQIVHKYDTLKEWYADQQLYHKIGFLIAVSGDPSVIINDLIVHAKEMRKSQLVEFINSRIKEAFGDIELDSLNYDNKSDKDKIRKVLLYFNVRTTMKSETHSRFSFKQYKVEKWDIEHVHARAEDEELENAREDERRDLLQSLQNQLEEIDDEESVESIKEFLNRKNVSGKEFSDFYKEISNKYGKFYENEIGNLVLLNADINRSYKNALFAVKRKCIIDRDKAAVFVPVCTKNVFLKTYSEKVGLLHMLQWNCSDAQSYANAIKQALVTEDNVCK